MKIFYLITLAFAFFFLGCSSTYKVSDFPSKDKFYEDFNKSMYNKFVKVSLVSDTTFIITGNVKISNDSLILFNSGENPINNISLEKIQKITSIYKGNNRFTGLWIGASLGFLLSTTIIGAIDDINNDFHTLPQFPANFGFAGMGGIIGYLIGTIYDRPLTYQFTP